MKHTPICCHPALQAWLEKGESSLRHKVWAWLSWQQLRHEFSGSGEGAESVLLGKRTVNHPERSLSGACLSDRVLGCHTVFTVYICAVLAYITAVYKCTH